jgi:wyosine [tRNA(Phe)-imidazoG37] synthetase (radical SAM superfamily)
MSKYIYGPVKSRRLGLSLGVSLSSFRLCSFDCVYCQLGSGKKNTVERKEYAPVKEVLAELKAYLECNKEEAAAVDYISISGLGEPTLHLGIGEVINGIRQLTAIPVAVISNSSLFSDKALRQSLSAADLIVPSLDAAGEKAFQRINRPHPAIKVNAVISGLINLRKEFKGKIWLEAMLVKGLNDDLRQVRRLGEAIDQIQPDKIQLNSPLRCTAEAGILAVDKPKLYKIKEILGDKCEIL